MIPREIIEEIIYRTDIEELIGTYVNLKRAGSNFNGLCPFHSEKTPSFTVFPATRSFYCFGCGAGGDAITFVMRSEGLDYVGALEFLASRAGITIPQDSFGNNNDTISRKRVYEMNLAAAKFFREALFDPKVGYAAMQYLTQSRRLSGTTIKRFGLGFAPNSFDSLGNHLRRLGFSDDEMVKGYLQGVSQKNGRKFDMFRNRIMFPIIDTSGNIIAFGGRVMDDSKPKYLNSSDTPAFKKSRNLYALNYAKNNCSEQIILCEGYMDVIALHAAGFENAVATLGTAITSEQARIMAKYTGKVLISYDGDEAGQNATDKAMRLLKEVGLDVRVLKLENAKDPDEYIKKFGADKFKLLLEQGRSGFEFKMNKILSKYDLSIDSDKIRASDELCGVIAATYSGVERDVYISAAAKALGVTSSSVKNDVEIKRRRIIEQYKKNESRQAKISAKKIGDRVNLDSAKNIRAASAEETILGLLLVFDEHREAVESGKVKLSSEAFFSDFGRRVFEAIIDLQKSENGFMFSMLVEGFTVDEIGRLQQMIQKRTMLTQNGQEVLRSSIDALAYEKEKNVAHENNDLNELIKINQRKLMDKKK